MAREVDLIEEVARCHGFDKVQTKPRIEIQATAADHRQQVLKAATHALHAAGYYETISVDFVDRSLAELFNARADRVHLAVKDVTRKGSNLLRQSLLGSLLTVLKTNAYAKNLPCRVFEISDTFVPSQDKGTLPVERAKLALVADGDLQHVRAALERAIRAVAGRVQVEFEPAEVSWAKAGAWVRVEGQVLGQAGVFSDAVVRLIDVKNINPVGAEIDFDLLTGMASGHRHIRAIPRFPAIERDLSIVVKESVAWADVVRTLRASGPDELEEVRFVEVYRGKGVAEGAKSVTLSIQFRDAEGTLTHETVDGYQAAMVAALADKVGAQLRAL